MFRRDGLVVAGKVYTYTSLRDAVYTENLCGVSGGTVETRLLFVCTDALAPS